MTLRRRKITLDSKQKKKLTRKVRKKVKKKVLKKQGFVKAKGGKYATGTFWSNKCQKEFIFRSAYEFAYFHILEADDNVEKYLVEPFRVPYRYETIRRDYTPDIMVLYADGSIDIIEIKPLAFIRDPLVQTKAKAAREFIKRNIPNSKYKFITEQDIFASPAEYKKVLDLLK